MKFFELVKSGTNHDFVKYRRVAVVASIIVNLIVLALAIGSTTIPGWPAQAPGLNYGVDFAGGTELQLAFKKPVDVSQLRDEISKLGFGEPTVQVYGNAADNQFLVRVERIALLTRETAEKAKQEIISSLPGKSMTQFHFDPEVGDKIDVSFKEPVDEAALRAAAEKAGLAPKEVRTLSAREGTDREYTIIAQGPGDKIGSALRQKFGADDVNVVRTEYVGPQVGKQLRNDGIKSVLYAMIFILIYVGFRFDFRFSPGVVIALIHDAIITLGFFVFTKHEFNLTSITVILTVVGYSVNDTIVVYDRIRENAHKFKGKPLKDLINLSINEMLGRTILTSGATALSLVGLIVYGVGTIQDFALAMLVGIISGTYSTWYIASPMTIWLDELQAHKKAVEAAKPRARPPAAGKPAAQAR
jgi:preprotein translocase subunit SecF